MHLNTNVMIALLTGRLPQVITSFENEFQRESKFAISCIVLHELRYGAFKSQRVKENNTRINTLLSAKSIDVLSFDAIDADKAGDIRANLEKLGTPIGPYDTLIAAQAIRLGATLVTANSREFARVPGLKLVNWAYDLPKELGS
jgi:tRNA(fMet)-specific endonuclease VapC